MVCAGGLVQVSSFAVLPDIDAGSTFAAVLISMGPVLLTNWRNPKPESFAKSAAYACLCRCAASWQLIMEWISC